MKPTLELRWHRLILRYEWSCQWDPIYKTTLQQKWIDDTGKEEWRALSEVIEEVPNCIRYG